MSYTTKFSFKNGVMQEIQITIPEYILDNNFRYISNARRAGWTQKQISSCWMSLCTFKCDEGVKACKTPKEFESYLEKEIERRQNELQVLGEKVDSTGVFHTSRLTKVWWHGTSTEGDEEPRINSEARKIEESLAEKEMDSPEVQTFLDAESFYLKKSALKRYRLLLEYVRCSHKIEQSET